MYPDSSNLSCLFHISRIKLVFSFCECRRNVQFGLAKLNTFMDSETSIRQNQITWYKVVQKATVLSQKLI
jgi:hypothetical protein